MVTKSVKEILPVEIISITGGLFAGAMLSFAADKIFLIPGLLILLPGFLEMRGSISGSLSARLSAGLFLGAIKPRIATSKILKGNVVASFTLVVFSSLFLGLLAYFASYYFFGIADTKIIFISLFAGILSNVVEIPLTILMTFWLFRHGHDPNNVMGPYITTTGDIVSILALLIAIVVI